MGFSRSVPTRVYSPRHQFLQSSRSDGRTVRREEGANSRSRHPTNCEHANHDLATSRMPGLNRKLDSHLFNSCFLHNHSFIKELLVNDCRPTPVSRYSRKCKRNDAARPLHRNQLTMMTQPFRLMMLHITGMRNVSK